MDNGKINLLHLVLDMDIGGLQRLVAETILVMDKNLFNIEVCCINQLGMFADKLINNGIKVTLLEKDKKGFDPMYCIKLMKYLRKNKIDVLQMHSGSFLYGVLAAQLARTKATVYTDHGRFVIEPKIRLIEDKISSFLVGAIIAVSNELRDYLIERVRLPGKKIYTVINGIPINEFCRRPKPEHLLKEFNLSKHNKVIGTVGRLDGVKDPLSLIKAFQLLIDKYPESTLMLVGDGPLRQQITDYINNEKLNGKVIITGARDDIADLLNLFDVFVLSSLSEGTSISLLEAMASGLPSVVTEVGGNPSIIDHGINGLLVKPRNINQIADSIYYLLSNDDKYDEIAIKAQEKVENNYSIQKMIDSYIDIYMKLLKKKGNIN